MNQTIKKILVRIKGINSSDAIYGGILIVFLIIVMTTFVIAVRFISSNINDIFTGETGGNGLGLDQERYERTLKKLGITTSAPSQPHTTVETPAPEPTASTATATPPVSIAPVAQPTLDRSTLTLIIKNSTTKKGAAGALASALQKEGFMEATTGNESQTYSVTTIILKEGKYDYATLILEEVLKSYPGAIATSTANTATYDATIIIGEK